MTVLSSPSVQLDLGLGIRDIVAVPIRNKEEVRRRSHPDSTMPQRNPSGEHDLVLENLPFIHLTIAVSICEDHDAALWTQVIEV